MFTVRPYRCVISYKAEEAFSESFNSTVITLLWPAKMNDIGSATKDDKKEIIDVDVDADR